MASAKSQYRVGDKVVVKIPTSRQVIHVPSWRMGFYENARLLWHDRVGEIIRFPRQQTLGNFPLTASGFPQRAIRVNFGGTDLSRILYLIPDIEFTHLVT